MFAKQVRFADAEADAEADAADDPTYWSIIDAAVLQFTAHGIRRTSIEAIARQAGISRPTLYTRFRDKDAIVQAIILRDARQLVASLCKGMQEHDDPAERLVRYFVQATLAVGRHPLTRKVMRDDLEFILPFMAQRAGMLVEFGIALIRPGLDGKPGGRTLQGVDQELLLEMLCRLAISIITQPSRNLDLLDDAKLERMARDLLVPMLDAVHAQQA